MVIVFVARAKYTVGDISVGILATVFAPVVSYSLAIIPQVACLARCATGEKVVVVNAVSAAG